MAVEFLCRSLTLQVAARATRTPTRTLPATYPNGGGYYHAAKRESIKSRPAHAPPATG
ncbi:MAG TPA: hypothetical protein VER76_04725 [Pyrinomonadaceae bacterium]|nr:hypothetical protein [Pyrinomonadaceae bacterium]